MFARLLKPTRETSRRLNKIFRRRRLEGLKEKAMKLRNMRFFIKRSAKLMNSWKDLKKRKIPMSSKSARHNQQLLHY